MNGAAHPRRTLTIDEYQALPEDERYRDELVRGRVVREPRPAPRHALAQTRVARFLDEFAEEHALGFVLTDAGVILAEDPPTVRGPDVSFISRERMPGSPPDGLSRTAPDLAVEILSPSNRAAEIKEKVREYLDAGVRMVWVVDPGSRTATVYRSRSEMLLVGEDGELDGADILPGLRLPLARLFPWT